MYQMYSDNIAKLCLLHNNGFFIHDMRIQTSLIGLRLNG